MVSWSVASSPSWLLSSLEGGSTDPAREEGKKNVKEKEKEEEEEEIEEQRSTKNGRKGEKKEVWC